MSAPLTCDEAEALLPLVADGSLDDHGDPALFAHLADCPRCQDSLVRHDLVTVAVERAVVAQHAPAAPRLRLAWRRWIPVAAAAALVVGCGISLGLDRGTEQAAHTVAVTSPAKPTMSPAAAHPTSTTALAALPAVPTAPAAAPLPASAPKIDIEVVAVPGSRPSHPLYLVRKGEQVLLVDPTGNAAASEAPSDALPASYTEPRRY